MPILYKYTNYEGVHDRVAHTAEHAFIGSLQKRLGQTLQVRKVEHNKSGNTAFIVIPTLELQTVLDAQNEVNTLIEQGRRVSEKRFESLAAAINAYPHLRANEGRITGEVRVVEIESHDVAACAMAHAEDLRECEFFLVTRLSKSGSEYEVDFVVGKEAREAAQSLSSKLMRLCMELGANINTVENTAKKIKSENDENSRKLKSLTSDMIEAIAPTHVGRFTLFKGMFSNLDDDKVVDFAGEMIAGNDLLVLIANKAPETARIVLARSEGSGNVDFSKLLKQIMKEDGRGGGKPHFVTGAVKREALERIMNELAEEISKLFAT